MEALIINAAVAWAKNADALEFGKSLIYIAIAYFALKNIIFKALKRLEARMEGIEGAIEKTNKSLVTLEANHTQQIYALGKRVSALEAKS